MHGLGQHLEAERCCLAVFLRTEDELLGVLASFYALGVARGGWLAHQSLPGGADRERSSSRRRAVTSPKLEADGQMVRRRDGLLRRPKVGAPVGAAAR